MKTKLKAYNITNVSKWKTGRIVAGRTCFALLSVLFTCFCSCKQTGDHPDHTAKFDSLIDAKIPLLRSGRIKEAFSAVDSVYSTTPYISLHDQYIRYMWKANVLNNMARYKEADVYCDSMLQVLDGKSSIYQSDYAAAFLVKGDIQMKLNEYNKAYATFYKGRQLLQQLSDTCAMAQYSSAIAFVFYRQKKYKEAAAYWMQQYDQCGKCDTNSFGESFIIQQGALDNIGLAYERSEMYDSAIFYYQRALGYIQQHEYKYPSREESIKECRIVIKGNLGNVYLKLGRLAEAELLFKENIAYNHKNGYDNMDGQLTMIKLAQLYIKSKRLPDAWTLIAYLRATLDKIPDAEEELRWRRLRWEYYDAAGDVRQTFTCYKSLVSYSDSVNEAQKTLPGADFKKALDQLDQQGEIAALQKEKGYTNIYLFIALAVAVMGGIIIYLVWYSYRQSRKNVKRQTKLNEKISTHNVAMQQTLNALEQSQQNNARMMRVVAHDLHNPVSAMVSLIDLLSDGDFDEEQKEMFQMLASSGTNALKLIGDILHTKLTIEKERMSLDELLTYSVGLMQYRANEKQQTLELKVVPVTILADREKIWRVINNLIVNAIKFSHIGKSIEVTLEKKDDKALLSVHDEGVGMAPVIGSQIFRGMAVGGMTGTSGEESFGMGLSISKQIIDAHGGRIWFDSEPGKGTTFYVELKTVAED